MKKLLTLALAVLMCVFAISAMADTVSIDRTLELQFVPSKDGTPIPAFLVHRNDVTPTGAVPTGL